MRDARWSARGVVAAVLLFAVAFVLVWQRVQLMQKDAEVARLAPQVDSLKQVARELSGEVAALTMGGHVAEAARERLGLVDPDPSSVVVMPWRAHLRPDSSSVVERALRAVVDVAYAVSGSLLGESRAEDVIEFPDDAFAGE